MDAYVLIGNPNTRKSSILRSITGCFNRSVRDIELLRGATTRLYARVAALQQSQTTAADFIAEVAKSRCDGVAFVLWPDANPLDPQRLPDAQAYIGAFKAAGWSFRGVAILGAHPIKPLAPNVARFPNVLSQPINATAHGVRTHFGWK